MRQFHQLGRMIHLLAVDVLHQVFSCLLLEDARNMDRRALHRVGDLLQRDLLTEMRIHILHDVQHRLGICPLCTGACPCLSILHHLDEVILQLPDGLCPLKHQLRTARHQRMSSTGARQQLLIHRMHDGAAVINDIRRLDLPLFHLCEHGHDEIAAVGEIRDLRQLDQRLLIADAPKVK